MGSGYLKKKSYNFIHGIKRRFYKCADIIRTVLKSTYIWCRKTHTRKTEEILI